MMAGNVQQVAEGSKDPAPPVAQTLTLASDVAIIAAPADKYAIFVTEIMAGNTSATLTRIDLKEGSGGTIRVSQPLAASGGGFVKKFVPWWELPVATGLFGALGTAVTDVRVNVSYFIGKTQQ